VDKELRILILEDVPADALLEEHELYKAGLVFNSKVVDTREAFLKALDEFLPDLILSDCKLPSFDGLEALKIVRKTCPDVPFILVTGELGEELAIETLKQGAADYVLKQKLSRLSHVVRRALQEAQVRDQKRQAEEALKESEKKYLDLYNNAPDGYHSLGPDGIILEVNDKWLKMFGYTKDEVIGKLNLKDILTENREEGFQTSFEELKRKGTRDNTEQEIRRKDGTVVPVIINASAIYDANGDFIKSRSIVRDDSERKNYEKMLINASEEWKSTFDSMPYGVLLVDINFNIQRANKYISNFCGIPLNDIKGKNINEVFINEQSAELLKSHDNRIIGFGAHEYYDSRYKKYFIRYETPIPGENGLTKALIIALVDISEMKDKEKKLVESREAFLNMLKEIDSSHRELQDIHNGLIRSFVNAIDAKSPWTKGHSERVTEYAISIARELGLRERDIETLRTAALLHDIGKIGTYDVVLEKPGKLTKEEFEIVKKHPEHGEQILRPIKQFQHLLKIIRHHHERIDGKGYPDGIKDDEIPLLSKIITLADSYDSMTSDRPYRYAPAKEYALSELRNCSGTQFDPRAAEAFLRVLDKKQYSA
jgi:PAS domain S-box-containing protein/putative nucleotidyltransferase with HDIG domain